MEDKIDIKTNPNLVTALGSYIRNMRLKKNIGLREMAEILEISPAYLSNVESGKHSMTNPLLLKKIAKYLDVDHLKLFKIIGYTDKDIKDLREDILGELIEELSDMDIQFILEKLFILDKEKIELVKNFISLL